MPQNVKGFEQKLKTLFITSTFENCDRYISYSTYIYYFVNVIKENVYIRINKKLIFISSRIIVGYL